ncbi:DUF1153 domain-containing protein [Abyssibius alkaniclasticus]|uniref:CtrA inhibitor SciP n=1 Tax=Abyssibius alkaniclasticus TaxID=2881234 RepID=UPI00236367E4|nr:DUF1153 domain-containing protein [Abyssibius alkaniclasticus]UPH70526.1 DUF1153 domain-containing protein [Abyssibius alkaniclasticus]|tara:strand:+ start:458 stop:736 length:279 start_codon:yes stop_codon:yes gene_type:complete
MFIRREIGPAAVRLPDGTILTRSDLPARDTTRWVAHRKAIVVQAVESALLTLEQACEMYDLSEEEFALWQDALSSHGRKGLLVTKIQHYRQP